jgi:predicted enzyme related to lactoylglutathione lyase
VPRLTGVSPVLLVADIERSLDYFREKLGFETEAYGDPPDFAAVRRDDAAILLALTDRAEQIVPNWKIQHNIWNAYIRVEGVDALYEEVQQRGAEIDYTIYDAPHGFREFGVQDPDGHDIAFGQPLDR